MLHSRPVLNVDVAYSRRIVEPLVTKASLLVETLRQTQPQANRFMRLGPRQVDSKYSSLARLRTKVSGFLVSLIKRWGDVKDVLSPARSKSGTELARRTDQRISTLIETASHTLPSHPESLHPSAS